MPFFQRKSRRDGARDLVSAEALALFGRYEMLGPELSGVAGATEALELVEPIRSRLYGDADVQDAALSEIRRHANQGEWAAVGAWKFALNFGPTSEFEAEVTDEAMRALHRMRITNLWTNLGMAYRNRYEQLNGEPVPDDGFFGPPVFASNFGPTRQYYFDAAIAAAAARHPQRVPDNPGATTSVPDDALTGLWDLGMLALRGPLLVGPDVRFEPAVVKPALDLARAFDHRWLAELLKTQIDARVSTRGSDGEPGFEGWTYIGGARLIEDYLDERLTGTEPHIVLIDAGLQQLGARGMLDQSFPIAALSTVERGRL